MNSKNIYHISNGISTLFWVVFVTNMYFQWLEQLGLRSEFITWALILASLGLRSWARRENPTMVNPIQTKKAMRSISIVSFILVLVAVFIARYLEGNWQLLFPMLLFIGAFGQTVVFIWSLTLPTPEQYNDPNVLDQEMMNG